MKLQLIVNEGAEALPILITYPDGERKLELHDRSCTLVFFAPGTRLDLYEPVELKLASTLIVSEEASHDNE